MNDGRGLRVWLVQIGEELPDDPGPPRLLRVALLARELHARGHNVTFWNATFNHQQKRQRSPETTSFQSVDGYRVILLKGRSYSRNISIARILSQIENARAFGAMAPNQPRPDVIVCGMPPIELARAGVRFAAAHQIPVAVDCRDMWPDVIAEQTSGLKGLIATPMLAWWKRALAEALRQATSVIGVSEAFVDWGLAKAGRPRTALDRAFTLTLSGERPSEESLAAARRAWERELGPRRPGQVMGVFAGTLSRRLDIMTFVNATHALKGLGEKLRIVICGKGDLEEEIRAKAADTDTLHFAGWRGAADLQTLMERVDFGVLPYPSTQDFLASFPNKVGEYLSFGLPIMTGLGGRTGAILDERGLRLPYVAGDEASARATLDSIAQGAAIGPSMAQAAKGVFREFFDPERIYPAFADYVEQLAGEH